VIKADDSTLSAEDLRIIERRARDLLNRSSAWDRFPTPIEDILAAANLKVAPHSIFDSKRIIEFIREQAASTGRALKNTGYRIKSAISKVLGLYDADDSVIHIDDSVGPTKQTFLKLHETGHHEIPSHRKSYRLFQDCEKTLAPEIADQFDREANNFARIILFQENTFARLAADFPFEIRTPIKLSTKFGASIYASLREYVRTNHRACAVYVLESLEYVGEYGAKADVRRIELSPSFSKQFGKPTETFITLDHVLGRALPIQKIMTKPQSLSLTDLNGLKHECLAEGFKTPYNIFILLYTVQALTTTTIIIPNIHQP